MIGVDQLNLPCSTNLAIMRVVNGLVAEPIMNRVRVVTGAGSSMPRMPNPLA